MPEKHPDRKPAWTEHRVEQLTGNLLRAGVLSAAFIVGIGATVYLIRHGGEQPHYRTFRGEPNEFRSVPLILREALAFRGRGLMQCGLLLLIATPIARVALSAFAFSRYRDFLYVAVSLIVLTFLCISLLGLAPS